MRQHTQPRHRDDRPSGLVCAARRRLRETFDALPIRRADRVIAPFLAFIVAVAMIVGMGLAFTPRAMGAEYDLSGDQTSWIKEDSSSVQFTGADGAVKDPTTTALDYGDSFRMRMEFAVPDDVRLASGDTLVYALPDGITYESGKTYPMTDASGRQLGSYVIQDGKVVITYTGGSDLHNITGFVTIDGTITSNGNGGNSGGKTSFEFPGYGTVDVTLNPRHEVSVVKNGAISVPGDPSSWDFVLDVTSIGTNTNVRLQDTMGELLTLQQDSIKIYTNPECTEEVAADAWSATPADDNHGFDLTIDSMDDNQKLYVKYRVSIDREQAIAACSESWKCTNPGNPEYDSVNNTVVYKSDEDTNKKTTEKGIWLDGKWYVGKWGTDTSDSTQRKITWTIEVQPGDDGIVTGATIKDKLGANLSENVTDLAIACYAKDDMWGAPRPCGDPVPTWDQLISEDGAKLPGEFGRYVLTYTTPISEGADAKAYTNDVTVTPQDGHKPAQATGTVTVKDPSSIAKSFMAARDDGATLDWMTIFTANQDLTRAQVTDTLDQDAAGRDHGPFQTLRKDSIKVYTDREQRNPWTGEATITATDAGFTIDFGAIPAGTSLFIFYSSTVQPITPSGETLYNTASDGTHSSTASHETVGENLTKTGWGSGAGAVTWRLNIHDVKPSATSIVITDTLPERFGYVAGSLTALDNPYWPRTALDGVQAQDNGDGTMTITVAPGTKAFEEAQTPDGLYLEYVTTIAQLDGFTAGDVTNRAHIAVNGVAQPDVEATVWVDKPSVVGKSAVYDSTTAPNIEYTVKVNEGGLTLNGGRTLTLEDTLGAALAVRLDSVAIRNPDNSELAGATYAYNPETRTLVFRVPDATACIITYKATVQLAPGSSFGDHEGVNTIVLTGAGETIGESGTEQTGEVKETKGGMSADGRTVQIFKYADHDVSSPLAGVQFDIEPVTLGDEVEGSGEGAGTRTVTGVASDIPSATVSTNAAGYTDAVNVREDVVYRITERTPAGFTGADPLYLIFPASGRTPGYDHVLDDGTTYPLTVSTMASHVWMCDNEHELDVSLALRKTDELGHALAGAKLRLTRLDGTTVDEWDSGADAHRVDDLKPGVYLLTETAAPDGYALADDVTIRVNADGTILVDGVNIATTTTVDGATTITGDVTMADPPRTTTLRAEKIWDDANDRDGLRRVAVFELHRKVGDGAWQLVPGQNRTVPAGASDGTRVTWTNLPVREGGARIDYRVEEQPIDGYASDTTLVDGVWRVTNRHTPETTAIRARKVWDDADDVDGKRPESVTVQLLADGKAVDGKTATLDGSNTWSAAFTDLPKYRDGKPVVYSIQERSTPEGYTVAYGYAVDEDGMPTVTVTNTHHTTSGDLTISKQDIAGAELAGASLRITGTTKDGKQIDPITWTSDGAATPITLKPKAGDDAGGDESEFVLLPGTYTLTELTAPAGYTVADPIEFTVDYAAPTGEDDDGAWTVTRTDDTAVDGERIVMVDRYRTTPVRVSKRTLTGAQELAGAQLEITGVRADGTVITPIAWTSADAPKELMLPPGEYTLRETTAPSGYERAQDIAFRVRVGGEVQVLSGGTLEHGSTVVMRDGMKRMDVYFSKTAVGVSEQLTGAAFTLSGTRVDGTTIDEISWTSGDEPHRLTLDDGVYTLTETAAPDGYEKVAPITVIVRDGRLIVDEIVQDDAIVHVEDEPTPLTAVSVTKQWQDNGDADKLRPGSVRVQLMADDKEVGEERTLDGSNNWTATWTALPARAASGERIEYTVRENLDGDYGQHYHVSLRKTPTADGFSFSLVNIHQPESTSLRLRKTWDDAHDQDGKRPTSIGVSIWGVTRDEQGKESRSQLIDIPNLSAQDGLLTADGDTWMWTLYGLPKQDPSGRPYTFELRETLTAASGYELAASDTCTDGWCTATTGDDADEPALIEFSNAHEPETVAVTVSKAWLDGRDERGIRPRELSVWLLSSVWDGSNGWPTPQYGFSAVKDVTFTELKNPITGSLTAEEMMDETTSGACVPGSYAYGLSCLILTKDGAKRPDVASGTGPAAATTDGTAPAAAGDADTWTATFENLPKYHQGKPIRYTVTEQHVPGYDASLTVPDASGGETTIGCDCGEDRIVGVTGEAAAALSFTLGNTPQPRLPSTGGDGVGRTTPAVGLGLVVLALIGMACLMRRRTINGEEQR